MRTPTTTVPAPLTLTQRLDEARTAWHEAFDAGQLDKADLAYRTLDSLLDQWTAIPSVDV